MALVPYPCFSMDKGRVLRRIRTYLPTPVFIWTKAPKKTFFSRELEVEISEKSCAKIRYFMNCEVNICLWIYDLFGN